MKDYYSFALLTATVAELVHKVTEQKFIIAISIEQNELVIKYTVIRFELPIIQDEIVVKQLEVNELQKNHHNFTEYCQFSC